LGELLAILLVEKTPELHRNLSFMLMVPTNYKAKTLGDPFQQFVAKKNLG